MPEPEAEVVRLLAKYVPRTEAAAAALWCANALWTSARRIQDLVDERAPAIRPRGDRDLLEHVGGLRGEIRLLQGQAREWLFTAERFGSTAFRWEDYATDEDPDPGALSRHLHGEDGTLPPGIGFPYLPGPENERPSDDDREP
ncbi:hypothetical protein [Cryptosporangium sp. NPDC048952]|uniref:hypothetical protein n=1 Tax=Cryptosporangium sp. NPDC048952 TaxID=3363961 RepID=UPI00371CE5EC